MTTTLLPNQTSAATVDARLAEIAVVRAIGNTPLLRLTQLEERHELPGEVEVWLKAEWANPGGSLKDRPALAIVRDALISGQLGPGTGKTLLDGTSGNMGIAYAMLGAAIGFPVELVLPYSASDERKQLLRAFGVPFLLSDPDLGAEGVHALVHARYEADPERYHFAEQTANPANSRAHYASTAPEIWTQTGGRITHLVAGIGTAGTLMGAGQFLKEQNPAVCIVAVEAATYPHDIAGLKHLPTGPIPDLYDPARIDQHIELNTPTAIAATRELARVEGLLTGPSTGAAIDAALQLARAATGPAVIVAIAPDNGSKYFSTGLWDGDSR